MKIDWDNNGKPTMITTSIAIRPIIQKYETIITITILLKLYETLSLFVIYDHNDIVYWMVDGGSESIVMIG